MGHKCDNCITIFLIAAFCSVVLVGIGLIVIAVLASLDPPTECDIIKDNIPQVQDLRNITVRQGSKLQLQCKVISLDSQEDGWKIIWENFHHRAEMGAGLNFVIRPNHWNKTQTESKVDVAGNVFSEEYICHNETVQVPVVTFYLNILAMKGHQGWYSCSLQRNSSDTSSDPIVKKMHLTVTQ